AQEEGGTDADAQPADAPPDDAAAAPEPPAIEPASPPRPALPPLAAVAPPSPPDSLDTIVSRLLALLRAGHADDAVKLEAGWRAQLGADDVRRVSGYAAVRWLLARELVGVAAELPPPVLEPLAAALATSDPSNARPALTAFCAADGKAARAANALLAQHAPNVFKHVDGCLVAPRAAIYPKAPRPPRSKTNMGRVAFGVLC